MTIGIGPAPGVACCGVLWLWALVAQSKFGHRSCVLFFRWPDSSGSLGRARWPQVCRCIHQISTFRNVMYVVILSALCTRTYTSIGRTPQRKENCNAKALPDSFAIYSACPSQFVALPSNRFVFCGKRSNDFEHCLIVNTALTHSGFV